MESSSPLLPSIIKIPSTTADHKKSDSESVVNALQDIPGSSETRLILSASPKDPTGLCDTCAQILIRSIECIPLPFCKDQNPNCMLCSTTMPRKVVIKVSSTYCQTVLDTDKLVVTSKYFFDSLFKRWQEASSGEYCLSWVRLQDFNLFTHFVGTGDLDDDGIDLMLEMDHSVEEAEYYDQNGEGCAQAGKSTIEHSSPCTVIDRLINGYLLGEYLQSPGFCNSIMDKLTQHYKYFFDDNDEAVPLWNLDLAFGGIRDSGLQRFVADVLLFALSENTLRQAIQMGHINEIAGEEISAAALRDREHLFRDKVPWYRNDCTYHDHPKGVFNSPCLDAYSTNGKEELCAAQDSMSWSAEIDEISDMSQW